MRRSWWRRPSARLVAVLVLAAAVGAGIAADRHGRDGKPGAGPSFDSHFGAVGGGPPIPLTGAYLGAAVAPQPPRHWTQSGRIESMNSFETAVSAKIAIAHVFVSTASQVVTTSNTRFIADGQHLLISWATPDTWRINSGSQDSAIVSMARQISALGVPVFLEPRWEMDRPNLSNVVHSPKDFVAAWKRIRLLFVSHGVSNVSWVWCPIADGFTQKRAPAYYPGDTEVDWICTDPYPLKSYIAGTYEPFSELIRAFMAWASLRDKPVMIGEFGVPQSYGVRRADWLRSAAAYIRSIPQIKAVVYFDGPRSPAQPWENFVLEDDQSALRAFFTIAHDSYFAGAK